MLILFTRTQLLPRIQFIEFSLGMSKSYNFTQLIGYSVPQILGLRSSQTFGGNLVKHSHVSQDNNDRSVPSRAFLCSHLPRTEMDLPGPEDAGTANFSAHRKIQGAVILRITKNSCKSLPRQFETRNPSSAIQLLLFKLERSPTI